MLPAGGKQYGSCPTWTTWTLTAVGPGPGLSPSEAAVQRCPGFPGLTMWSATVQLFGINLPVSWYFRLLSHEYDGFRGWGWTENEVGGTVRGMV